MMLALNMPGMQLTNTRSRMNAHRLASSRLAQVLLHCPCTPKHLHCRPAVTVPETARLKAHSDSNMGSLGPSMLLAFDFDHTIVDGNTDTHVIKASPSGRISDELKSSYQPGRWTEYMQRIFDHLHAEGVSVADMQRVLQQLPYTQGMEQLLQELQGGSIAGQPCSCIILSDSNSQFIDWILCSRQHRDIFSHVYTNPASISTQGQLHVTPHHNHACGACPVNMCKREILQMHHQSLTAGRSEPSGLRVAYVGDGGNDLCPAQSLGAEDVVFARAGYALDKMLQEPAVKDTVKAHVHVWSSAAEIVNVLRRL